MIHKKLIQDNVELKVKTDGNLMCLKINSNEVWESSSVPICANRWIYENVFENGEVISEEEYES